MFSKSIILSAAILATSAFADNNGQWNPAEYGSGAYTAESGDSPASSPTSPPSYNTVDYSPSVTSAPAAQAHYTGDWQYTVTWPAGCSTWANPCPSGVHVAGSSGGDDVDSGPESGYTNAFTSYLTQTNSNGVITGMPSVATVAAGVSANSAEPSTMQTSFVAAPSSSAYGYSNSPTTSADSSWSSGSSTTTNAATSQTAMRCSALLVVAAVAVSLFC